MIEVLIYGRGGQGVVTSAEILAKAAGLDNKFSQAFPSFGPERRGAPVRAFCRIDDQPITIRSHVYKPDYVIVLDSGLMELPEISDVLKQSSMVIVNSEKPISGGETKTYNATKLALEIIGKPIVNTAMLGIFAKTTGLVSLESLKKAIEERFTGKLRESNKKLVEEVYNQFGQMIMSENKKEHTGEYNPSSDLQGKVSEAAVIKQPGSSRKNKTGSWRTFKPIVTDKCTGCGICTWYCPENCIKIAGKADINYDYCKGCGICANECPAKAIEMKKENEE